MGFLRAISFSNGAVYSTELDQEEPNSKFVKWSSKPANSRKKSLINRPEIKKNPSQTTTDPINSTSQTAASSKSQLRGRLPDRNQAN